MADKAKISSELSRELTLFQITMMGLGMMIGAGVFLGIGNSIYVAGPGGALLTFLLNGLIAMFTAFSYAELSSAIPYTGGAYNYTRIGFGKGSSFLAGWMEWFASSVAGSLYAVTFAIYVVRFLQILGLLHWLALPTIITEKILAVLIAFFFFYINYRGASETGKIGAFFTLGQTLFLVFIGAVGVFIVLKDPSRLENFKPFMPHGWSKLLITMGFTYVAFEGYEVIAQTGDETINPRQNLPKAMLYSVYIVTITYILVAFAAIVAVKAGSPGIDGAPWQWIGSFRERGFGEAVSRLMPMGNLFLTLAVIFASTSALNATIYSATRALYALGRDNMLPQHLAKISKKQKTPWAALLATGTLVIIIVTLLPTMDVASSASMMFLILFFMVNLCVIRVRWNLSDELTYGYVMPFFPIFPLIAIILQIVLAVWLIHMSWIAWIIVPLWIIGGCAIYQAYSKHHTIVAETEIRILAEETAPEGDEYRIMVALANPANAIELVRTTYRICGAKKARVELIHMVPVPDQAPLSDASQYMLEGREAIVEAMLYLEPLFPLSTTIRYCRNIARGILSTVREKKADMLIVGWHGRSRTYGFRLGSTIDPIIERSACDVVIIKDGSSNTTYERVLVALSGAPNGGFALDIAGMMTSETGTICAFTVASEKNAFDIVNFVKEQNDRRHLPSDRITTKAVYASDITNAIIKEAEEYDLLVMGFSLKPRLYQVARQTIPESVAKKCQKPLIMVKEVEGLQSWIKRWI